MNPSNNGIKVIQHIKAAGNVRSQNRASMFPIYKNTFSDDVRNMGTTPYGREIDFESPVNIYVNASENIIGWGRIESMNYDSNLSGNVIENIEKFRLYYLPIGYISENDPTNDYSIGNPPLLPTKFQYQYGEINLIQQGTRIWLPINLGIHPWGQAVDVASQGKQIFAYNVLASNTSILGEEFEYQCVIAKSEGVTMAILGEI